MSKHITLTIKLAVDETSIDDVDGLTAYLQEVGNQLVERDDIAPQGIVLDDYNVEVTCEN